MPNNFFKKKKKKKKKKVTVTPLFKVFNDTTPIIKFIIKTLIKYHSFYSLVKYNFKKFIYNE